MRRLLDALDPSRDRVRRATKRDDLNRFAELEERRDEAADVASDTGGLRRPGATVDSDAKTLN